MQPMASQASRIRVVPAVRGAVLLAFLLVAAIWATTFFRADARMRRASARVVRLAEKPGAESPVALGLAANRLGQFLATNAVLELEDVGTLATGRQEIVQLFVQVRSRLAQIEFAHPVFAAVAPGRGLVNVQVSARYRLVPDAGAPAKGNGQAVLAWTRGQEGWRIARATLRVEDGGSMPGDWP